MHYVALKNQLKSACIKPCIVLMLSLLQTAFAQCLPVEVSTVTSVAAINTTPKHIDYLSDCVNATVVRVSDGDTIWVYMHDNNTTQSTVYQSTVYQSKQANKALVKVRLNYIDAPERDQPSGKQATQALRNKIQSQYIQLHTYGIDKYGRTLATVWLNGEDINAWLISHGYAWAYTRYLPSTHHRYMDLQQQAHNHQVGLWSEANPIAPWHWRHPPHD